MVDLGVLFDRDLSFAQHICLKAYKMLGFIRRHTYHITDTRALTLLYNSLVRSILEYNSCIWSPFYNCHIARLDNLQARFVRYLLWKYFIPYSDIPRSIRLQLVGFKSLEGRRNVSMAMFLYKMINGTIDCSELLSKFGFRIYPRSTRSSQVFMSRSHHTNYGFSAFCDKVIRCYNDNFSDCDMFGESGGVFKERVLSLVQ